jgi:CRISPR-associated endonuclease Csn1
LGLCEPVIIVPEMRKDSLLEINGSRFMISGRTGNQIILRHTYQLLLGSEKEQYIKNLVKYDKRCKAWKDAKKEELPVTEYDGISAEENVILYHLLAKKCNEKVYDSCFGEFNRIGNEMVEYENKFIAMSIWGQTKILLQVLKAFRCNAEEANFKDLSGVETRGKIRRSKKISELSSAYMINQSITGLYEQRVDLLK